MADEVEHTEFVGQAPGFGLVEPHEGRMDAELLVHGEVERDVETLDESVAAVGIAREVSLSDARNEVEDTALASINGGDTHKEEVATRDEGVGRTIFGFITIHREGGVGEGIAAKLSEERDIHHFEGHVLFAADFGSEFHFVVVLLSVGKGECADFRKFAQSPKEAGGRILST